ncbi:MAG: hypothetical protein QNJ70_02640 [Xenococcaceae cyanobacterium MO_207.B15]|nr:hypothetical protein [Xenococcaceae cyanobacterium MO_207.B15]
MSPNKPIDINKIKQLIATATTAKQKRMYQKQLVEAELSLQEQKQEQLEEKENTVTEPVELVGKSSYDESEEKKDDSLDLLRKSRPAKLLLIAPLIIFT